MPPRPQEIGILKSISYDRNIVQFYGACLKSATNEPMLLLEYCEGGDVRYRPRSLILKALIPDPKGQIWPLGCLSQVQLHCHPPAIAPLPASAGAADCVHRLLGAVH